MKFFSRSDETDGSAVADHADNVSVSYESIVRICSKTMPGVRFEVNRMSFGRRMELSRRIRELSQKAEFFEAGNQLDDKIEAGILSQEVDAIYIRWGLVKLEGLEIDGAEAGVDGLLERGPEELAREIVAAIKAQCGLSEAERLIVAFHFQFANRAAWKCDICRKSGLEKKRRCGWMPSIDAGMPAVVWARNNVVVASCPTSFITAESVALLEEFHVWKLFGASDAYRLPARLVDAIFIIENELRSEKSNAPD